MRPYFIITGIIVALAGAWQILVVCAFAMATDPDQPEAVRNTQQWEALAGVSPAFGLWGVVILLGLYLIFRRSRP